MSKTLIHILVITKKKAFRLKLVRCNIIKVKMKCQTKHLLPKFYLALFVLARTGLS